MIFRMSVTSSRHAVILAAGKGTRFKSDKSKVLHEICGRPMITYLLDRLPSLGIDKVFVVVDNDSAQVREALKEYPVDFILQEKQLGTGHAIMCTAEKVKTLEGILLVLYGDTPFISTSHMETLFASCEETGCDEALLTTDLDNPAGYGRIQRDSLGNPVDIIEEKEASPEQKKIREINAGFACFKIRSLVEYISTLSNDNNTGEYYLTDMVKILGSAGKSVQAVKVAAEDEIFGINDRIQLASAEKQLQKKIVAKMMAGGTTILNPESVFIHSTVESGRDTRIYPGAVLEGNCRIGNNCVIGPNAHLVNAVIGDKCMVQDGTSIADSRVGAESSIGPFARLRNQTLLGDQVRIGNFVEVKNSRIGDRTIAAHLTYLGDAEIGPDVNIGAGTVTCNFDGEKKNITIIEERAFIGSNVQIIAPVKIGKGATVAAGSTITEDVPPGELAIARSRQSNRKR